MAEPKSLKKKKRVESSENCFKRQAMNSLSSKETYSSV